MNKAEWNAHVATRTVLPKAAANNAVGAVLAAISDALAHGDAFSISGFGSFTTRTRPARKAGTRVQGKLSPSLCPRGHRSRLARPSVTLSIANTPKETTAVFQPYRPIACTAVPEDPDAGPKTAPSRSASPLLRAAGVHRYPSSPPFEELSECGSATNSRCPGLVTARSPDKREADTTDPGARPSNTAPLAGDTKEACRTNPSQSLLHPLRNWNTT